LFKWPAKFFTDVLVKSDRFAFEWERFWCSSLTRNQLFQLEESGRGDLFHFFYQTVGFNKIEV